MPLTSQKVNDYLSDDATFCVMLYGLMASGKTTLTASAQNHPGLADLIYVDADPGLVSVVGHEGFENVNRIGFDDVKDLQGLPQHIKQKHPTVKTVVFDSFAAVASTRLAELSNKRPNDETDWRDYGTLTRNLEKIVHLLRGAGYNIIMTAGVKEEEALVGNSKVLIRRRPDFSPELYRRISHFVNYLWQVYQARDGSYNLQFLAQYPASGGEIVAKTQNDVFAKALMKLQRPNLQGIIQIGQAGQDLSKYPNLATFYDLYLKSLNGETK